MLKSLILTYDSINSWGSGLPPNEASSSVICWEYGYVLFGASSAGIRYEATRRQNDRRYL